MFVIEGAGRAQSEDDRGRGEETRRRLIQAALEVFGSLGFDGASTRALAAKAGVSLASIPYYFGGKEGLYRASAEFLAERLGEQLSPTVREINAAVASGRLPRPSALALLQRLLEKFAAIAIGVEAPPSWIMFILREELNPGGGFEVFYERVLKGVHATCSALLGHLLGQREDEPEVRIAAMAVLGQILVFRTGRAAALRSLGWKEFSGDRLKLVQSVIRDHVNCITSRTRAGRIKAAS